MVAHRVSGAYSPGAWPQTTIGMSDDVFGDTVRAAQIILGLQR